MTHSEFIWTKKCNIISFITAGQHSASVADPGYLPCIMTLSIPNPGSRIPDPTKATKEEGKFFLVFLFFEAQISSYFRCEIGKEKIWYPKTCQ
jgi:hypothetical protein